MPAVRGPHRRDRLQHSGCRSRERRREAAPRAGASTAGFRSRRGDAAGWRHRLGRSREPHERVLGLRSQQRPHRADLPHRSRAATRATHQLIERFGRAPGAPRRWSTPASATWRPSATFRPTSPGSRSPAAARTRSRSSPAASNTSSPQATCERWGCRSAPDARFSPPTSRHVRALLVNEMFARSVLRRRLHDAAAALDQPQGRDDARRRHRRRPAPQRPAQQRRARDTWPNVKQAQSRARCISSSARRAIHCSVLVGPVDRGRARSDRRARPHDDVERPTVGVDQPAPRSWTTIPSPRSPWSRWPSQRSGSMARLSHARWRDDDVRSGSARRWRHTTPADRHGARTGARHYRRRTGDRARCSRGSSRLMAKLLYGVEPLDAWAFNDGAPRARRGRGRRLRAAGASRRCHRSR